MSGELRDAATAPGHTQAGGRDEPIGILKLAEETKIPSHKVRYSLRVLEQEDLIRATAPGAVTTNQTVSFLKELDSMIEDLSRKAENLKMIKIAR